VATVLSVRSKDKSVGPQSVAEVLAAKPPVKVSAVEPPLHGDILEKRADTPAETGHAEEPWLHQAADGPFTSPMLGKAEPPNTSTNTDGTVYGFTGALSPVSIAAAMARLSRRGDDMRITLLDEFIGKADKDAQLLQAVIPPTATTLSSS